MDWSKIGGDVVSSTISGLIVAAIIAVAKKVVSPAAVDAGEKPAIHPEGPAKAASSASPPPEPVVMRGPPEVGVAPAPAAGGAGLSFARFIAGTLGAFPSIFATGCIMVAAIAWFPQIEVPHAARRVFLTLIVAFWGLFGMNSLKGRGLRELGRYVVGQFVIFLFLCVGAVVAGWILMFLLAFTGIFADRPDLQDETNLSNLGMWTTFPLIYFPLLLSGKLTADDAIR